MEHARTSYLEYMGIEAVQTWGLRLGGDALLSRVSSVKGMSF